jgi:hypothetical protein
MSSFPGPRILLGLLLFGPACSGADLGPAPVIDSLTFQSPVASDTTHIKGTVHVKDPLGLTTLATNLTVLGPGPAVALPPLAVESTVEGQLEATVGFTVKSKAAFQSGTYRIVVTLTEDGTPSNALTGTVVVE